MGRGVSSGGGQSSLNYLFGGSEAPKPAPNNADVPLNQRSAAAVIPSKEINREIPAGVRHNTPNNTNNYFRADGQNTGNFITERPSVKVQTAPGGGSSLDYLFGGGGSK